MVRMMNMQQEGVQENIQAEYKRGGTVNLETEVIDNSSIVKLENRLEKKHSKYACYKWSGFISIVILALINCAFNIIEAKKRIDPNTKV